MADQEAFAKDGGFQEDDFSSGSEATRFLTPEDHEMSSASDRETPGLHEEHGTSAIVEGKLIVHRKICTRSLPNSSNGDDENDPAIPSPCVSKHSQPRGAGTSAVTKDRSGKMAQNVEVLVWDAEGGRWVADYILVPLEPPQDGLTEFELAAARRSTSCQAASQAKLSVELTSDLPARPSPEAKRAEAVASRSTGTLRKDAAVFDPCASYSLQPGSNRTPLRSGASAFVSRWQTEGVLA